MPRKRVVLESVELTLIRKKTSIEGKLLDYLKQSERGASEQVLRALIAFYLPFMNDYIGASEEEIRYAALEAISELEMQALKIKRAFGLDGISQLLLVQPTSGGVVSASIPAPSISVKETTISDVLESKVSSEDSDETEEKEEEESEEVWDFTELESGFCVEAKK